MARDLKAGEPLEADVVDLAHDGRGIARLDGKAVFIEGALPGERVRFRVTKRRRRLEEAVLLDILTASPDRVTPRCVHFGLCGGCSLQHLSPEGQLAAKQRQLLDNLERIGGVRPLRVIEALKGPAFAYRRRARLGVKYVHKKGRVLAGFRERDKPYLADLRRCEILLERFATLPEELATLVETLSIREHIPQVEVAAGDERAALVFRIMAPLSADDAAALERFGTRLGVQIHLQPGGLDTIRPLLADAPPLEYVVDEGRVTLEFGPSDFVQINRDMNLAMIDAAQEAPRAGAHRYGSGSVLRTGQFHVALEPTGRRRRRAWRATRVWCARPAGMRCATASATPSSSPRTCSSPLAWDLGPSGPSTSCSSTRRGRAPLKSWNVWHSGGREGSCIFPAIQGAWHEMPESWCAAKGIG